ncbi:hypothetical protein IRJ41_003201 [Triplophysa rosa]|uniref:SCAN box domain-containing protein n=1 Tax=Triplophysa rosa TaxID=992332 RepID=A0A9W7X2E6_TRIRA|nr:hypothetical protein IRJ41_003201 [Triplophysa rosa]
MNRGGRKAAARVAPVEVHDAIRELEGDMVSREVTDLTGLFRAFMAKMDVREVQEQERRSKGLQHQFSLLQLEVQARTTPTPNFNPLLIAEDLLGGQDEGDAVSNQQVTPSTAWRKDLSRTDEPGQCQFKEPKLEKFTEFDDVEHFLITFERIAAACRWTKQDWAFRLLPLLTGKARAAYVHMDVDESLIYENVKSAILRKFEINRETYRQRFRLLDVEPFESPKELYVWLKEQYVKWMQPKGKNVEEIGEVIILEQYLQMLSPELQVWVREHDPKAASEVATFADVFVTAHKGSQLWCWKTSREHRRINLPHQLQRNVLDTGNIPGRGVMGMTPEREKRIPICYLLPLQPLPLISTPFERLGMDIVGPVETSRTGNRFMLVYKLLDITSLRTTPYHPQPDGLTERFNQTLNQMLRKFVNDSGKDWDQWIPYLLFAYREVPQSSTGFSPFELLYGRQMRDRLDKMTVLARSLMAEAQRCFEPGQKVLVILPSQDSKLLAKWQGPYEVKKKLGPTTYEISAPGQNRQTRKYLMLGLLNSFADSLFS